MQVFTSLPPKVDGDIKCYLRLRIPKISYIVTETAVEASTNKKVAPKFGKKVEKNAEIALLPSILAKCVWWGEDEHANGAIFRPKIVGSSANSQTVSRHTQTTAKYMVRSGGKQFTAYLSDMKTLDIELLNEATMQSMGKCQLFEIQQLSATNPVKGYFSAYDSSQTKIADVFVHAQLESLSSQQRDESLDSVTSRTRMSDQSGDEDLRVANRQTWVMRKYNSKLLLMLIQCIE